MSTDDPPERTTPPDKSMESSAAKIKTAVQEALNTAMENGANLEEASTWLALNLAKTTIQLNPNSNQLDPEKLKDMTKKALDIKGNRETSEAMEKVLRNAKERYIQVYTTMDKIPNTN